MSTEIDSLLDSTLDDLVDLPESKAFPVGVHKVLVSLSLKTVNDKPAVEMVNKFISAEELSNPEDTPPNPGDECNVLFFLDNEFGQGKLKEVLVPLSEALGTKVNREIIEQTTEMECLIVTSLAKNKNDADSPYMNIKGLVVV